MCYAKPGPRCTGHVKAELDTAVKNLEEANQERDAARKDFAEHRKRLADEGLTEDDADALKSREAYEKAAHHRAECLDAVAKKKAEYDLTPGGMEDYKDQIIADGGDEEALEDIADKIKKDEKLDEEDFEEVSDDPALQQRARVYAGRMRARKESLSFLRELQEAYYNSRGLSTMMMFRRGLSHQQSMMDQREKQSDEERAYRDEQLRQLNHALKRSRHDQKAAAAILDRDNQDEHIKSIEKKHMRAGGDSSTFTDYRVERAEDVMMMASAQRGGLHGDDREQLIASGADPDSLLPPESGARYLQVQVSGVDSMKSTADMKDKDVVMVHAQEQGNGKPPLLTLRTDVKEPPHTKVATVVLGPKTDKNGEDIPGTTSLLTMHPGMPHNGISSDTLRSQGFESGTKMTVKELREKFGKDIRINFDLIE